MLGHNALHCVELPTHRKVTFPKRPLDFNFTSAAQVTSHYLFAISAVGLDCAMCEQIVCSSKSSHCFQKR